MKIRVLFACVFSLLIMSAGVMAQQPGAATTDRNKIKERALMNKDNLIRQMLGRGNYETAEKATSVTAERLTGQSRYGMTYDTTFATFWGVTDSARYQYSGQRGSRFNFNNMAYNNAYNVDGLFFLFGSTAGYAQNDNNPDLLSDTCNVWQTVTAISYFYSHFESMYATYDAHNNITDYINYYGPAYYNHHYLNTYNSANQMTTSLNLMKTTSTWDTTEFRTAYYSGGHITTDSTTIWESAGVWAPDEAYTYSYDSYGNISSIGYFNSNGPGSYWTEWYRYDFTYYPSQQLKKVTTYAIDTTGTSLAAVDTFGWSAGVPYYTFSEDRQYSGGMVTDSSMLMKHVSATSGLPDTTYAYGQGQGTKTIYTYDSYNLPVRGDQYNNDPTTAAYDTLTDILYYYYETYVSNGLPVVTANESINIYPNPAKDELFIVNSGTKKYARIEIINMAGQIVADKSVDSPVPTERIYTGLLLPGNYWVVLLGENGSVVSKGQMVKL